MKAAQYGNVHYSGNHPVGDIDGVDDMMVEPIWTGNRARNFNYLIACAETGEALAIDPCDYRKCLTRASEKGWNITQVINTHEHPDHIAGNGQVIAETGARLLAHRDAGSLIPGIDAGLRAGDVVHVGRSVRLRVLDTPGHTMCHLGLLSETDPPCFFCGDTLFNAGVGHCRMGGDPIALYRTVATQIAGLPGETRVYPGHEYLVNNLGFTLDREPDNIRAADLIKEVGQDYDPDQPLITTIGLEREINTFLRLTSPTLIDRLRTSFPDMPADPGEQQVFLNLRRLRDHW